MMYNQILECTIANKSEIHENSVLLACSTEYTEEIDIINDFFFNTDYEVVDIQNMIEIESLEELYEYILEKNIHVNSERIKKKGILVGDNANILLKSNLKIEDIE